MRAICSSAFVAAAAFTFSTAAPAPAAPILLDFGSGTGLVSAGAAAADSPAHATGAVPSSQTTWNQVTTNDIAAGGLVNADGSGALNVAVNLGHEVTIGSNVLDFAAANAINAVSVTGNNSVNLGTIYAEAGPTHKAASDGIFRNGTSQSQNAAVGLRIDGLDAGTYTLYFSGRNTNVNSEARPVTFYTTVGASAATFDFSSLTGATASNANLSGNNTWIAGNQYATASVTVAAGQSVFVAAEGPTAADLRGFINTVEVVPEPAGASMLAGAALVGLARRRRRTARA